MKAQCPSCETAYRIDDSKIPEKGIYARCPKCQTRIFLKKEDSLQLENPSRDEFVCPKCGHEQPESESPNAREVVGPCGRRAVAGETARRPVTAEPSSV